VVEQAMARPTSRFRYGEFGSPGCGTKALLGA
jgi:hypothetical protein